MEQECQDMVHDVVRTKEVGEKDRKRQNENHVRSFVIYRSGETDGHNEADVGYGSGRAGQKRSHEKPASPSYQQNQMHCPYQRLQRRR